VVVATLAARTGLYRSMRNAYQRTLNRSWWAERQRLRALFRQYVLPGELVFDIGANHGDYSEVFYELGGRVVAVEPNPALADAIRQCHGKRLVDVVCAAVSFAEGTARLHVAGDDQHSTLSEEWMAIAPETSWRETITVPATTLDSLIRNYGVPGFVKIDVETYDPQVLQGLSVPVRGLSFEWVAALPGHYETCVRRLAELGDYELTEPPAGEESGDIFARLRG
jgi:FkbM family methyltransferase